MTDFTNFSLVRLVGGRSQAQAPRFTFDQALEVVQSLRIDPREDHKTLAKRLRKALQERRIALKHVNALHAAARLNGHASWHTDDEAAVARLRFEVIESGPQMWQTTCGLRPFIRCFGIVQVAFSKSTSSQVAWISSLLRTSVSRIRRNASLMVG